VSHGTDRPSDAQLRDVALTTSVANPRRTRVDAEGRPRPKPAAQRAQDD
jgi:hypothetical protein